MASLLILSFMAKENSHFPKVIFFKEFGLKVI